MWFNVKVGNTFSLSLSFTYMWSLSLSDTLDVAQMGNINTEKIQVWHMHKNIDKTGRISVVDAMTWVLLKTFY